MGNERVWANSFPLSEQSQGSPSAHSRMSLEFPGVVAPSRPGAVGREEPGRRAGPQDPLRLCLHLAGASWALLSSDSPPFRAPAGGRSRARSIVERRGEARGSRGWVLAPGSSLLAAAASGGPRCRDAAGARGWRAAQQLWGHVRWPRQPATMSLTARVSCSMLSCFVSARPVLPGPGAGVGGALNACYTHSPAQGPRHDPKP